MAMECLDIEDQEEAGILCHSHTKRVPYHELKINFRTRYQVAHFKTNNLTDNTDYRVKVDANMFSISEETFIKLFPITLTFD